MTLSSTVVIREKVSSLTRERLRVKGEHSRSRRNKRKEDRTGGGGGGASSLGDEEVR